MSTEIPGDSFPLVAGALFAIQFVVVMFAGRRPRRSNDSSFLLAFPAVLVSKVVANTMVAHQLVASRAIAATTALYLVQVVGLVMVLLLVLSKEGPWQRYRWYGALYASTFGCVLVEFALVEAILPLRDAVLLLLGVVGATAVIGLWLADRNLKQGGVHG